MGDLGGEVFINENLCKNYARVKPAALAKDSDSVLLIFLYSVLDAMCKILFSSSSGQVPPPPALTRVDKFD